MPQTILVTGATGFLGSNLVEDFLQKGHRVAILKRKTSHLGRIESLLPQLMVFDVENLTQPFRDCGPLDAVVHTATNYGRQGESLSQIFEANTAFPVRLLEAAIAHQVPLFVNTHTILEKELNPYALSKHHFMEWGQHLAGRDNKTHFVNIRLEHMFGPGDDESKFTTYVIKNCLNNIPELPLTLGEQRRDFIYIADVVSAYQLLLSTALHQPDAYQDYDLGSGQAISIRYLVETIHQLTHSSTQLKFGALSYRPHETFLSQANIEPLQRLGWFPQFSLTEGLRCTIESYA